MRMHGSLFVGADMRSEKRKAKGEKEERMPKIWEGAVKCESHTRKAKVVEMRQGKEKAEKKKQKRKPVCQAGEAEAASRGNS